MSEERVNRFRKSQRLCSEKEIGCLYDEGKRITCFPFRVVYRPRGEGEGVKVMIVAPKRNFKHAVDRNRWRRMIREAYRVRQGILEGLDIDISILVIESKMVESNYVGEKMEKMLMMIKDKMTKETPC